MSTEQAFNISRGNAFDLNQHVNEGQNCYQGKLKVAVSRTLTSVTRADDEL